MHTIMSKNKMNYISFEVSKIKGITQPVLKCTCKLIMAFSLLELHVTFEDLCYDFLAESVFRGKSQALHNVLAP